MTEPQLQSISVESITLDNVTGRKKNVREKLERK